MASAAMERTIGFVLEQGLRGHHHLFEPELVRFTLRNPLEADRGVEPETAARARALLDELRDEEGLDRQRDRIAAAPLPVQEVLVHLYFDYLQRMLDRAPVQVH